MKRWIGWFMVAALGTCRTAPPSSHPVGLSLRVWERTIVGTHYEAFLSLKPQENGYVFRFVCTPRLVYRNDCPCDHSEGWIPDSALASWMDRVIHLPDTLEPWVDASLTRVVIHGDRTRVIRYPANLLKDLFPLLCTPTDTVRTSASGGEGE